MNFLKAFYRHPDLIICLVIAIFVGTFVSKLVPVFVDAHYGKIAEEHKNDVGMEATDDTPRAYSIDDLLSNEYFAIVVDDSDHFAYDGSARSNDLFSTIIYNVRLQSGERVAVKCDSNFAEMSEDGVYLLCVGEVKWEDLAEDADMLADLQEKYSLDRTDFYVDASINIEESANYSAAKSETMIELLEPWTLIFVSIIVWIILHCITVKIGIAPALFKKNR
jgi:hypothetical protein